MKTASIPIDTLRERLIYEPDTGLLRWRHAVSRSIRPGQIAGSIKADGYINILINRITLKAHRVCWAIYYGQWPRSLLDHKNGSHGDNRIANLREATLLQNGQNRHARLSSTGFKGVTEIRGRFQAQLSVSGKQRYFGMFDTAIEAALRHDQAAIEHHGEFANLNFPASPSTGEKA